MKSGFRVIIASARVVSIALLIAILSPVLFGQSWVPSTESTPLTGSSFQRLRLADFNGDGRVDAAVVIDGNVSILGGDGKGGFPTAMAVLPVSAVVDIGVGDFDGNGTMDVLVLDRDSQSSSYRLDLYSGDGKGGFSGSGEVTATGLPGLDGSCRIDAGKLEKHSLDEADFVLLCGTVPGTLFAAINDGGGSFTVSRLYSAGPARVIVGFSINGDARDGLSQVAVTSAPATPGAAAETDVFNNVGGALSLEASAVSSLPIARMADYDGDTLGDVVTAKGGTIDVQRGNGKSFSSPSSVGASAGCNTYDVAAGDLEGVSGSYGEDIVAAQVCSEIVGGKVSLLLTSFLNVARTITNIQVGQTSSTSAAYTVSVKPVLGMGLPTGDVGVSVNSGPPVSLPLQNGQASGTASLGMGANTLTAVYGSSDQFSASWESTNVTVSSLRTVGRTLLRLNAVPLNTSGTTIPTITLSSSPNPSMIGQTVAFQATWPTNGTGTMSYYDNGTLLGTTNGLSIFQPNSLVVNPSTNMVYATNRTSAVTFIGGATNSIVAAPRSSYGSLDSALDTASNTLYVDGFAATNGITAINASTGTVVNSMTGISLSSASGYGMSVNPNTHNLYVATSLVGGPLYVVNDINLAVSATIIPLHGTFYSTAVNPNTNTVYACDEGTSASYVDVISGATNAIVTSIALSASGCGMIAVNPNTNMIYAVGGAGVAVINGSSNTLTTTITGVGTRSGAINTATNYMVTTNGQGPSSTFYVINLATNSVVTSFPGGNSSNVLAINSATNTLYSAELSGNSVSVWSLSSDTKIATIVGGTTAFTTSSLAVGTHPITAVYSGDSTYSSASTNVVNQVVQSNTPTVSVSCSPVSFTYSSSDSGSTCSGTVSGGSGTPTGTVTFSLNGATQSSVSLSSGSYSFVGICNRGGCAAGSYSVTVAYSGDSTYSSATGGPSSFTINKATPSLSVSCSPNPITYGSQTTSCTPSISSGTTGSLSWTINGGAWTTGTLSQAQGGFAGWSAGVYTIGVSYSGDANNNQVSASATLTISKATPSITATCTPNPVIFGSTYSCSASVSGGATGTVSWPASIWSGTTTLSSGSTSTGALTATATPGSYGGTVTYNGDGNNNSVSTSVSLTVSPAASTVTVNAGTLIQQWQASALNHTPGDGSATSSYWVATPSSGTGCCGFQYGPYASNLLAGAVNIATWSLSIDNNSSDNNAVAYVDIYDDATNTVVASETITREQFAAANTFQTFSLPFVAANPAYEYEIRVAFDGNSTLTEAFAQISGYSGTSKYGQPVTLVASVPIVGSVVPTGTITFYSNGTAIGTAPVSAANNSVATATLTLTTLPIGADSITVQYSGDSNYSNGTSSGITQTVVASTETEVSSSVNPTTVGQNTTFSALVDTGGETPTGTVTYSYGGSSFGSANVTQVTTSNLIPNSNQILETGSSWNGYCESSLANVTPDTPDLVAPDGSSTATKFVMPTANVCGGGTEGNGALIVAPSGLTTGATYTASLWLRGASGGEKVIVALNDCSAWYPAFLTTTWKRYSFTWSNISASITGCSTGPRGLQFQGQTNGTDTWYVWGAQLEQASQAGPYVMTGSSPASGSGGISTLSYSGLPAGADLITASYSGDANDDVSSGSLAQTVNLQTTSISISNIPSGALYGGSLSPTYNYTGNGTTSVTSSTPSICTVSGSTVNFVGVGTCTLTPSATETSTYAAANGSAQSFSVGKAATVIAVNSSVNPSLFGQSVTFTITVSGAVGYAIPTGSVSISNGATPIGTITLSGGSGSLTTSALPTGSNSLTITYQGDGNYY